MGQAAQSFTSNTPAGSLDGWSSQRRFEAVRSDVVLQIRKLEADEASNLYVGQAALGDESANEALCDSQVLRSAADVQQQMVFALGRFALDSRNGHGYHLS